MIIGCPHINHDPNWETPIWKTRGYNSAAEHTEGFIKNWNSKASLNTIGFFLGDICFNDPKGKVFKELFTRLVFKEAFCLPGNHQSGFRQVFEECEENIFRLGEKKITFVPNYLEAFINNQAVVMSHFPLLSWNGQSKNSIHLFCHVHNNLGKSQVGKAYLESGAKAYEVSVECNPFPPTFAEIKEKLKNREPISFDHHDANTQNPF